VDDGVPGRGGGQPRVRLLGTGHRPLRSRWNLSRRLTPEAGDQSVAGVGFEPT